MLLSRETCTISANIIVRFKRLQEYVKSFIKDDKNVLKPETSLQKTIRIPSGEFRILDHVKLIFCVA